MYKLLNNSNFDKMLKLLDNLPLLHLLFLMLACHCCLVTNAQCDDDSASGLYRVIPFGEYTVNAGASAYEVNYLRTILTAYLPFSRLT